MEGVIEKAAVKRVPAALREHGLEGEIHILSDSARTAKEAAAGLGIEVGQIASSLIFKLPDNHQIRFEKVGQAIKPLKRLTF